jgi:16S rRNA (cytosine967-C5)-methyltransferase
MKLDERENLYKGPRGIAIKILNRIERTDAYLDKMIDSHFKEAEMSDLDKSLMVEIVHGVIRWKNRLDWVLSGFYHGNYYKSEINLKNTLRVAVYQVLFLDKIPEYAIVNEAVDFIKRLNGEKAANLINAVLRNILRSKTEIHYPDPKQENLNYLSVYYSHPSWMVKRWLSRFGFEETEKLLISNNQNPGVTIRINRMKIEPVAFLSLLDKSSIKYQGSEYLDYFIKVIDFSELIKLNYFSEGYFSIQDESAALPTLLLQPQPVDIVIDLCAAPGGKTAHIAETMKNTGKIIAVDKFDYKLKLIQESCSRLGIRNVETIASDAGELKSEPVDKILADVPCSGLGVLRKKPDIRWKREPEDIPQLVKSQKAILNNAIQLLKTSGVLVYSTCTMEPEENFLLIQEFLKEHAEFIIDDASKYINHSLVNTNGCVETFPHKNNMDGSFAVRLIKTQ